MGRLDQSDGRLLTMTRDGGLQVRQQTGRPGPWPGSTTSPASSLTPNRLRQSRAAGRGNVADLRPERPNDHDQVRDLHLAAFGDHGLVAGLVDDLRLAVTADDGLSLVAEVRVVVGHVMFTGSLLDARAAWFAFRCSGPLAVAPTIKAPAWARPWSGVGSR